MKLESNQIAAITQWYQEGASLSDLQKRLKSEFGLTFTYLDVRLLIEELKLTREEPDLPPPPPVVPTAFDPSPLPAATAGSNGNVSVTMDTVQRPDALLSGKVIFSDGQSAEWYVDQSGRLALNPSQLGYRPSKNDIMAFQVELEKIARKRNF